MFMGFGKRGFCTVFLVFLTILVCGNIHKKKETGWFVQGLLSALDSSWAKEVFAEEKTKTQTVSKYPLTVQFIQRGGGSVFDYGPSDEGGFGLLLRRGQARVRGWVVASTGKGKGVSPG